MATFFQSIGDMVFFIDFVFFFRDDGVDSVSESVDDSSFLLDVVVRFEIQVLVSMRLLSIDFK